MRAEGTTFDLKDSSFDFDVISESLKFDPAVINKMQIKVTREQKDYVVPPTANSMKIKVTRNRREEVARTDLEEELSSETINEDDAPQAIFEVRLISHL